MLRIRTYEVSVSGDLAVVIHLDEIPVMENGRPAGTCLFRETWRWEGDGWKLHLLDVDAVHAPSPVAHLTNAQLNAFASVYRRKAGVRTVEVEVEEAACASSAGRASRST